MNAEKPGNCLRRNQRQFPIFMFASSDENVVLARTFEEHREILKLRSNFGRRRKRQWDMNDLEATTFENGWLAYMVKAVD